MKEPDIRSIEVQHFSIGMNVRTWLIDLANREVWTRSDFDHDFNYKHAAALDREAIDDFLGNAETWGFLDWQGPCIHPDVISGTLYDGHQWSIKITLADGTERQISGNNSYPDTWGEMGTAFKNLTGEHIF